MAAPKILELSNDEIVTRYSDRVFRRASNKFAVPAAVSGQYVSAVGVVTNVELNDTQIAQLEAAIEAITGVSTAKTLIGPSRLSLDRMPEDTAEETYSFQFSIEMGFDVVKAEVTP